MRAALTVFLTTAAFLAAPAANAAPPAPQVTVGADIKQLIFDWDSVSGAGYYRLLYKIGGGAYKPLIDNIPASSTQVKLSVAVHLQSWPMIRYAVAACNTSGCTNSTAIFPQNLMLDSIGYFKASNTDPGDNFGTSLVLSDDGRTLAVAARLEGSNASGVNGNQADNSSKWSGAVYVFHRTSSGWRQEAYLKAGVNQPQQFFGSSLFQNRGAVAINANGSLLAVSAPNQDVGGNREAGVVYVYQRSSSGSWSLAATLNAPTPLPFDLFGYSVDMSLDGRTLKVDSFGPRVQVGPDQDYLFRTHIFVRPGITWQHSVTLAGAVDGDQCQNTRLSRDGNTLVSTCDNYLTVRQLETFKRSGNTWTNVAAQPLSTGASGIGLALDFDASTMALQEARYLERGIVGIYRWTGATWAREAGIPPPAAPDNIYAIDFGRALALSRTGNLVAIGDSSVAEDGAGVSLISRPGPLTTGAVYIWKRDDRNATWNMRSVVKSPNPRSGAGFGGALAMCGTGHALAVGADLEDSKAKGVDGDRTDHSAQGAGAAYLY